MPKPYENPLTPNATLRALYRAMVELRAIAFPRQSRKAPRLEAAYAAPVLGLLPGDLTSSPLPPGVLDHLRAIPLRPGSGAPKRAHSLSQSPLSAASESERLLLALGQAQALKTQNTSHCVVVNVAPLAIKLTLLGRIVALAAGENLPVVFVTLPAPLPRFPSSIPRIPVDGSDPIAIFRVTQECLVRARAGGGPALLECVPSTHDPIQILGAQLVARGIATPRWLASVTFPAQPRTPARVRKGTLG